MGSGNDRDRQKRLQRKRAKRAAKRATRQSSGAFGGMSNFADNPFGYPDSPDDLAALTCIQVCTVLFAECRILDDDLRREILDAVLHLGGVWLRLPFELEAFLCKEAPWSLTCADLEPLRRIFAKHGAQVVFGRLWTLALTNEPDAVTRLAAAKHPDCAHRAALGFDALRVCLDDPGQSPAQALRAIVQEMEAHSAPGPLRKAYKKLLLAAVAAAHAPAPRRSAAVEDLARTGWEIFEPWSRKLSTAAWWQAHPSFRSSGSDGREELVKEESRRK